MRREHQPVFPYPWVRTELPILELVENQRRSIAMLAPDVPALNREEALELREQLETALLELRRIKVQVESQ